MPKFIGCPAPIGATALPNNTPRNAAGLVCLTHNQMRLLPASAVRYSLDTTDRGGPRTRAKRWYRWFAAPHDVAACPRATPAMRAAAWARVQRNHPLLGV